MDLFIVRHGAAMTAQADAARPLSPTGRAEVERVATRAVGLGARVSEIRHSGKTRAEQTAEILASHLEPPGGIRAMAGLGPEDDPESAREEIELARDPLMLVGHLPHVSRLTSLLVIDRDVRELVAFGTATLVRLERSPSGWRVRWVVTPEG